MALRSEFALGHSEFNDFLFAFVGEEKSGIQLTVLSAYARLGLDPWGEAARLSGLTREAATTALAAAIVALPEGNWKAMESRSIAGRLVDRLPKHVSSPAKSPPGGGAGSEKPRAELQKWMIWIGFSMLVLIALLRQFGN